MAIQAPPGVLCSITVTYKSGPSRALNVCRAKPATKLFIKALSNGDTQIRLEGCKALHRVPDPEAAKPLLALATRPDEDKDVRIAAVEALAKAVRSAVACTSTRSPPPVMTTFMSTSAVESSA